MNRNAILVLVIIVGLVGLLTFFYTQNDDIIPGSENETPTTTDNGARGMSIEQYVRNNISELSPVSAVLGGTFYVTAIEAADGRGVVEYEDGHIALVADFTYEIEPEHGAITITSFTVREQ